MRIGVALLVGLVLSIFIISSMLLFSSAMMKAARGWEERGGQLSGVQMAALEVAHFIRRYGFLLAPLVLILCFGGPLGRALWRETAKVKRS